MSADVEHLGDELDLLLDGRLDAERRSEVEAHLGGCPRCRRELQALRLVKAAARAGLPERDVPAQVTDRVAAELDREEREAGGRGLRAIRLRWGALVGAGLGAAAVVAALLLRGGPGGRRDFVAAAALDLARFRSATITLELETPDPAALEQFFAASRLRFSARVFDFGMMGYRLSGGRAHRLAGRPSALFAYRGAGGRHLLCQMYEGRLAELPAGFEEREHDGIRFRIYRTAGLTLVFWQEGTVVCVLASDGDSEEAVQFAYAKAIRVEGGGSEG